MYSFRSIITAEGQDAANKTAIGQSIAVLWYEHRNLDPYERFVANLYFQENTSTILIRSTNKNTNMILWTIGFKGTW